MINNLVSKQLIHEDSITMKIKWMVKMGELMDQEDIIIADQVLVKECASDVKDAI